MKSHIFDVFYYICGVISSEAAEEIWNWSPPWGWKGWLRFFDVSGSIILLNFANPGKRQYYFRQQSSKWQAFSKNLAPITVAIQWTGNQQKVRGRADLEFSPGLGAPWLSAAYPSQDSYPEGDKRAVLRTSTTPISSQVPEEEKTPLVYRNQLRILPPGQILSHYVQNGLVLRWDSTNGSPHLLWSLAVNASILSHFTIFSLSK